MAKYSFDESFFEKIDTEEKAYWLGFITADGSLCTKFQKFRLSITSKDISHLEKWKSAIKFNGPVLRTLKIYGMIHTSCKKIIKDLEKLNITPNKTYTLRPPPKDAIPENLINHYIRGFFDGDGCFTHHISQTGRLRCKINFVSGSQEYLLWLKDILKTKDGVFKRFVKNRITNHYNLDIGSYKNILRIMDWMYQNATVFLDRKKEKYLLIRTRIYDRIYNKGDVKGTPTFQAFGENKSLSSWIKDTRCKCSRSCLYNRIRKGWNIERAITTGV